METYPQKKYHFRLRIDGEEAGEFSEVNSPSGTEEGNMIMKWGRVNSHILYGWMNDGNRKTITIELLDMSGAKQASWIVLQACPVQYNGAELGDVDSVVAVERLELAHEGLRKESS